MTNKRWMVSILVLVLGSGASAHVCAQEKAGTQKPAAPQIGPALQRAILIEEQEHDLQQAVGLYEKIAGDATASAADRARASLRLGMALRRLGQQDAAEVALRRAAQAGGEVAAAAAKLLQDKDGEAQEKEVRRRAREILRDPKLTRKEQHLLFLGQAAVPEIVRYSEELWAKGADGAHITREDLAGLLWQLGGDSAQRHLQSVAAGEDVKKRAVVAKAIPTQMQMHSSLLPVALEYCGFPETDSYSLLSRLRYSQLTPRQLLPLTGSPHPSVVRSVWVWLAQDIWHQLRHERDIGASFALIAADLIASLDSDNPEVRDAARRFLFRYGLDTVLGRRIFLRRLPSLPQRVQIRRYDAPPLKLRQTIPPGSNLQDVVDTARKLGTRDPGDYRANSVESLVKYLINSWETDALPQVLELARLGYVSELGPWLMNRNIRNARQVLTALDGRPADFSVLEWLKSQPREPGLWPFLQRIANDLNQQLSGYLLAAMAHTGADGAIEHFFAMARDPGHLTTAAHFLIELSRKRDDEPVRQALRDLLRMAAESKATQQTISLIAARLLQLGDLTAVRMFPAINTKLDKWVVPAQELRGYLSPFSSAQLEEAWRVLLDDDDAYWDQAAIVVHEFPPQVVAMVADRLAGRVRATERGNVRLPHGVATVLERTLPRRTGALEPAVMKRLDSLMTTCLESARHGLRRQALEHLKYQPGPNAEHRTITLRLLRDPDPEVARAAAEVVTSGLAQLSVGEFDKAMQECSPPLRELLSNRLPSLPRSGNDWADDAVALGRRLLGDESSAIRGNACNLLARCTDARAVPDLLTALRDPHEKVRKAAGEALAAIRFYHEQQGHWDRTFKGAPRLDANSAAEALVKQADGKQKKSTRLLAIESMGLLGKVETLPFLIDYTLESDAEIVSAARAAIAAVQAKAAVNGK